MGRAARHYNIGLTRETSFEPCGRIPIVCATCSVVSVRVGREGNSSEWAAFPGEATLERIGLSVENITRLSELRVKEVRNVLCHRSPSSISCVAVAYLP